MTEDPEPQDGGRPAAQQPEMTRERARTERRDLDKERGEPVSGTRGARRSLKRLGRPLGDWSTRPRILVTNDDGIESRGLLALKRALDPVGEVTVVAPDTNQSAVGHQKTLMRPLRVRERTLADGSSGYSIDGSPTDCVSLAFLGFFDERFDLVASGINYGANLGDDITYSGTVSAAMEAVINNCPAFAISQEYVEDIDFSLAGIAAAIVARNILEHGLKRGELLSVNVPGVPVEECEGIEITRVGRRIYQDELIARVDPRGIPYYWLGGPPPSGISIPGTDFHAVVNRRVSVTPIHLDLTGRRLLRQLQEWDWSLEGAPPGAAMADAEAGGRRGMAPSPVEQERIGEETQIERR
jgi:5'-nucleotidase